jgi:hypothetical protein
MRSPWPAAALLTIVTLATIGAVVIVATPSGCRLAQKAGFRIAGARCQNAPPVAVITNPPFSPIPATTEPVVAPPTTFPSPVYPSPAYPSPNPGVPHDPSLPPYQFDTGTSGAYPPSYPEPSGSTPDALAFSCRLPIYNGGPGSGGFLVFPDRSFVGDPRSGVTVPSPSPAATPPAQGPYGQQGFYGLTYDRAAARWVPVPRTWITPDGKSYAYAGYPEGIYVVDVAANTQTEIGEGHHWAVLDVEAEGVYAGETASYGLAAGLWLIPFAGSPTQLTNAGYWNMVGGGAAYGTANSSVPNGVATLIDRFDLRTHTTQHWFQVTGASSYPFGFDASGRPIFAVQGFPPNSTTSELWLVTGLGTAEVIAFNNNYSGMVADAHGIWLMNYQQLHLLVPGQGLYLAASIGGQLAGACV